MVATVVVVGSGIVVDGNGTVVDEVDVVDVVDEERRGALVVVVDASDCDRGLELPHPVATTAPVITTTRHRCTSVA